MKQLVFALLTLLIFRTPTYAQEIVYDNYKAVILAYYRIGEDGYPTSNIRKDQFENHIREILSEGYTVMPVPEILRAIQTGTPLPPRTIGLTFQGGFRSVLDNAAPLLFEHSLPFTIFYAADTLGNAQYLDWKDLKFLSKNPNATLGIMPAAYDTIANQSEEDRRRNLNKARIAFRDNFGSEPQFFAYPFGEFDAAYKELVKQQNFQIAFGIQSGPVYEKSDMQALPRFAMTENYGDLERFRIVANAFPLPAQDIEPQTSLIETTAASVGFTIPESNNELVENMRCYSSSQGALPLEILGETRIELRPNLIQGERTRINCTISIPGTSLHQQQTYRWLGFLLSPQVSIDQQDELLQLPE